MESKKQLCLSLALAFGFSTLGAAQARHGGSGHGGSMQMGGGAHNFGSAGHSSFGASNGFRNPRGYGYGPSFDGSRRYNRGYRGGIGVGVIPFYPIGGYAGYDGAYDGAYDDGDLSYDPSIDEGQPSPYMGPYADPSMGQPPYAQEPYTQQPYPPPQQPYAQQMSPAPLMAPSPPAYQGAGPVASDAHTPAASMPPVTLVLRTGQQIQVKNFAVANGFFWDFSRPSPHKIPIANIDVPASAKMTEASGGEFPDLNENANAPDATR